MIIRSLEMLETLFPQVKNCDWANESIPSVLIDLFLDNNLLKEYEQFKTLCEKDYNNIRKMVIPTPYKIEIVDKPIIECHIKKGILFTKIYYKISKNIIQIAHWTDQKTALVPKDPKITNRYYLNQVIYRYLTFLEMLQIEMDR